jgi:hypothetical protein
MFRGLMLNSALREPFGDPRAARESAELLKRLSDTGLSRFEPDPLAAIAEAEQRLHFRPISRGGESGRDGRNWHFSEVPIVYDLGLECTPKRTSIDRSEFVMPVAEISSALFDT